MGRLVHIGLKEARSASESAMLARQWVCRLSRAGLEASVKPSPAQHRSGSSQVCGLELERGHAIIVSSGLDVARRANSSLR